MVLLVNKREKDYSLFLFFMISDVKIGNIRINFVFNNEINKNCLLFR